jgi:hypothetical protein
MNYFEGRTVGRMSNFPAARRQASQAAPSPVDFTRFLTEGLFQPLFQGLNTAAVNFADSMTGLRSTTTLDRPSKLGRWHSDCGCGRRDCGCKHQECCGERVDPCHCNCCIVDADLIVYTKMGETRVISLTLENSWRRERKIKMELSHFTRRGGAAAPVTANLLPPAPEFELGPCAHRNVVLAVAIGSAVPGANRESPDVDDCTVYYADLRVEGCEIRPIRIALAVLPRDCDSYQVECGCGCCC